MSSKPCRDQKATVILEYVLYIQKGIRADKSKSDKFVMRSQLDAQDSRLPGTGVFDIKTRAAVAIRYDPLNYHVSSMLICRDLLGSLTLF